MRTGIGSKGLWVAAAIVVAMFGLPSQAHAALSLNLDGYSGAPAGGLTCVDNAACDGNPAAGAIVFTDTVGQWTLNVQVGTSNAPGGAVNTLHLTSSLQSNAGGTLTMTLTETAFTAPANTISGALTLSNTGNGVVIGNGSYTATAAKTNEAGAIFVQTDPCAYAIPPLPAGGNFAGCTEVANHGPVPTSYGMFLTQTFTVQAASGPLSLDTTATNTNVEGRDVPEPTSLTLLGLGFAGISAALRRRRKQAQQI